MKKILLSLLLVASVVAGFAQSPTKQQLLYFASQQGGGAPSTAIPDVDFTFKHIQRTNAAITLSANIAGSPTLTSVVWQVRDKAGLLVGIGTSGLSESIPAITTRGFYDVYCWIKTATDQYPVEWEDAFFVNTPKYTEGEADDVIDLAGGSHYVDYGSVDNSGRTFYVKNSGTMGFWPYNLHGTAANPVIIQKEIGNTQIVQTCPNAVDAFTFLNNRHIIYDGYNDDGTRGWKIVTPTAGLFTIRSSGSQWTDIKILGFDLDRTGTSNDRAQISFVPVVSVGVNATNWIDENSAVYDCRVNGSGAEAIYFNYTNDTPQSGNIPAKSKGLVIAWNDITNTGNDAVQVASSIDSRIHHNYINTWGMQVSASHENAFSINEGNTRLRVFSNFAINGDMAVNMKAGLTPWDIFNSETTPGRNAIYGNIFIQGTPPSGGTPETVFNYFQTSGGSNTAEWPLQVFNNTFVCNKLGAAVQFNVGAFTIPNLVFTNNIFVKTGTAGDYSELDYTGGGTLPTSDEVNNLVYPFSNYTAITFSNGSGTTADDYKITSLASPVYTGASNISSFVSGVSLVDYTGLPFNASGYAYGAYSGYDAKTIAPTFNDAAAATFSSALAVGSLTEQGGTITFNANKEGLLYWSVVANNATAPTIAQLKAGGHGLTSGEILDPGTALTGTITGLSPSTAYDLYGVFVTKEDVAQASVTKVDFTTTADVVAPTLSGWQITNAQPGRVYFNSSEVITATTFGGFTIGSVLGTVPTVTGVTINTGSTTGHYFTMSANFGAIDYNATIAYSGSGSNLQDAASNALASFTATAITNNIVSTRINVNIRNNDASVGGNWNNAPVDGSGSVRSLIANLIDDTGASTGYALAIHEAFHNATSVASTGGGLYLDAFVGARGIECYSTSVTSNAGTFRISGLPAGATGQIVYGTKGTFNTPTGTVSVTGGSALAFANAYTEYRQAFVADVSGNLDITMTQSTSNASIVMVGFIIELNP